MPVKDNLETPESVAAEVDRQVQSLYCLHPTNIFAYQMIHGMDAPVPDNVYMEDGDCDRAQFEQRIEAMPAGHRPYALAIYANAVTSKLNPGQGA
jgi:hypothetical protein